MEQGVLIEDVFRLADGRLILTMGLGLSERRQIAAGASAELMFEDGQVSQHQILQYDVVGRSPFLEGEERKNVGLVLERIQKEEDVPQGTRIRMKTRTAEHE